jgi:hypothetical protein
VEKKTPKTHGIDFDWSAFPAANIRVAWERTKEDPPKKVTRRLLKSYRSLTVLDTTLCVIARIHTPPHLVHLSRATSLGVHRGHFLALPLKTQPHTPILSLAHTTTSHSPPRPRSCRSFPPRHERKATQDSDKLSPKTHLIKSCISWVVEFFFIRRPSFSLVRNCCSATVEQPEQRQSLPASSLA